MPYPTQATFGKYEAALFVSNPQTAQQYLDACVEEAIHAGPGKRSWQQIANMERDNILDFAKRYDPATRYYLQRLFNA